MARGWLFGLRVSTRTASFGAIAGRHLYSLEAASHGDGCGGNNVFGSHVSLAVVAAALVGVVTMDVLLASVVVVTTSAVVAAVATAASKEGTIETTRGSVCWVEFARNPSESYVYVVCH